MSDDAPYDFQPLKNYAVVSFNPALGDCKWGDIERVGNELRDQLALLSKPVFLLDLSKLDYMGSSVVALIVKLWKTAQERDGDMVVVNTNSMIREVLDIAGLSRVWTIVGSRDEAEEILGGGAFNETSSGTRFLLAILGWVAAAGAAGAAVVRVRGIEGLDPQVAQLLGVICGAIACLAGLVSAIRDSGLWRVLGILLVVLAVALIGFAVVGLPVAV